jgi:hypothetical protein
MKPMVLFSTFLFFTLCSLAAFGEEPRSDSTQEMLSACRPIAKAKVSDHFVAFGNNFETGKCWGAFSMLQSLSAFVDMRDGNRLLHICSPEESRLVQLIAIFVDYAEKNPQRWHEPYAIVAFDAYQKAFPCESKK